MECREEDEFLQESQAGYVERVTMEWSDHATRTFITHVCRHMKLQGRWSYLRQGASAAFSKQSGPGPQLHAALEGALLGARLGNAHVIGGNACHCTIPVQHLAGCKAWVYLHTRLFCLLAQPPAELTAHTSVIHPFMQTI